jgi:1-deoxy-D-xylulose-5-phosphate reductoisomerase
MVEFVDGSVIAQLGVTDMRLPIQYACSYPERWASPLPSLDLARAGPLEFLPPSPDRFPCLRLAYEALRAERTVPVVLNAANEVAVEAFLERKLGFTGIPRVIEETIDAHHAEELSSLQVVQRVDAWAREYARERARGLELTQ